MDALSFGASIVVYRIETSNARATAVIEVPDLGTLNEMHSTLRYSATFEDAYLIVTRDDGMNVVNRSTDGQPLI